MSDEIDCCYFGFCCLRSYFCCHCSYSCYSCVGLNVWFCCWLFLMLFPQDDRNSDEVDCYVCCSCYLCRCSLVAPCG